MTDPKLRQGYRGLPQDRKEFAAESLGQELTFEARVQHRAVNMLQLSGSLMGLAAELVRTAQGIRDEAKALITHVRIENEKRNREAAGD